MANEEEILSFEVTDQDLDEEFNFNLRRPRISKNRATYGIWAENSDDDDDFDARPSFGGAGGRHARDYSTPVGFVSAGIQQAGKKKEDKEEEEDPLMRNRDPSSDEGEESGTSGIGFRKRDHKKVKYELQGQIAGLRNPNYKPTMGKGFGEWEKHTKGIGAKLLLKMGFEVGKGLGKDLQGRSQIVEAHLRKGRGAIGAYGHEGGRPRKDKRPDSEEEEEKKFKEQLHQWKRGSSGKKNVKYVYKTTDQILEDGKWRKVSKESAPKSGNAGAGVKVIDMTGKEERVLSGYHAIAAAKRRPDEDGADIQDSSIFRSEKANFEIPELVHNINLLMNTCEEDLISADRKLRYHKDRVSVLQSEEERLARLVETEQNEISTLEGVLELVEKLETLHEEKRLDMNSAMEMFKKMSSEYSDEYRLFELPYIATTIVSPLLKSELLTWKVLDAPFKHKITYAEWKDILYLTHSSSNQENDPFYALVWESWMPSVRSAIQTWNTRNPDALIDFLKGWSDLIPGKILSNILDLIVLPKLQSEVTKWDPLTDPVRIDAWLHPWLGMVGNQLEIVYPTIKNKLSLALQKWHPSDHSARLILLPWKDVFDAASMHAFLLKNITPKLETVLHEFVINPFHQDLAPWNWVISWKDILSQATLVAILEKHFFPKWLEALARLLGQHPDFKEVANWYQGWKEEFGKINNLLNHQQVKMYLKQAMEMMQNAVQGTMGTSGFVLTPPPPPPPQIYDSNLL